MAAIADPKLNGAELVRELKKTGTSPNKLELATQLLGFIHRKENRIATAVEIIDAMEKAGRMEGYMQWDKTPELTLKKAVTLATTGKWDGPVETTELSIEDRLLAGMELPPEEVEKTSLEEMAEAGDVPLASDGKTQAVADLKPAIGPKRGPGRPKKTGTETAAV